MIKGISQMFSKEGTPKGYAYFSKNIIINQILDEIINEKGTKIVTALSGQPIEDIVGLVVHGNQIIIFYLDISNNTVISVYDEDLDTFEIKLTRTDLGFNSDFPISGTAKLNSEDQLIVTFTDNNVTPKYINLDLATPADSLSLYELTLLATNPFITFEIIEGGGALKTGVHFLAIQYEDLTRSQSNFSTLSSPIYITLHNDRGGFNSTQGSDAGLVSSKGVKFTVTNVDTSFKKIRATLITKINDTITVGTYKEIEVTSTTLSFTITGTELAVPLDITEVLTLNQVFKKIKHLETLSDQLFAADYEIPTQTDFQNIANRIRLEWVSTPWYNAIVDQDATRPVRKSGNNQKTFIHDEVYAIYAQFELIDDTLTQWFHIPGKALTAGHRASSSLSNGIKFNGNTPKLFQLQCTTTLNGTLGALGDTETDNYAYGDFGVWENENETYPSNFPDFAGQKVRHHRFPSLEWLRDEVYTGSIRYLVDMWDQLGIKHTFNLTDLDPTLLAQIRSIRIGYAKRDISNMSVIGYDVVQLAAYPETGIGSVFDNTLITSSGGNWRVAANGSVNDLMATNDYIRLHSPDVMLLRPSTDNLYLANQIRLKITDLNEDFFTTDITKPYGRILSGGQDLLPAVLDVDVFTYVSNFMATNELTSYSSLFKYIPLTKSKYLPANSSFSDIDGNFNNLLNEECLFGKPSVSLLIDIPGIGGPADAFQVQQGTDVDSPGLWEEVALSAIKTPRTNFFTNYQDQIIIPINSSRMSPISYNGIMRGDGDAFICVHSFLTMASAPMEDDIAFNLTADDGIRCVKIFLCESRYNLNERYITQADYNTYFFPAGGFQSQIKKQDYWFTKLNQLAQPVNSIQVSKSFHSLNDFEQHGIFDHTAVYESKVPYGIARSLIASRSTTFEDGWRQFRPNDVFFTIRNKGKINNLVAWGSDKLLIHHQRALLITRDKAVLQSDITEISLGSGDLFAIEPKELVPTKYGYGGTQHKFGCILCEAGYAFVDKDAGEVLLLKEGDNYINIGKGFQNFFKEQFEAAGIILDNPFKASTSSISLSFNKRNYSLVLSLKATSIRFTAMFDLIKQEWIGLKDYITEGQVNTRKNLYSFNNKIFYQHNTGKYGEFYGIIYPSFVDIIINDIPDEEKILAAIEWITRVEKDGVTIATETITSITVWNDYFCTGKIDINPLINLLEYENKNSKSTDRTWRFADIKGVTQDITFPFVRGIFADYRPISSNIATDLAWFEKEEVRGKYFIVRLEYSNIEDKLVSLRQVIPNIKRSSA